MTEADFLERGVVADDLLAKGVLSRKLAVKLAWDLGDIRDSFQDLESVLAALKSTVRTAGVYSAKSRIQLLTVVEELKHMRFHIRGAIPTLERAFRNMHRRRRTKKGVGKSRARGAEKPKVRAPREARRRRAKRDEPKSR